MRFILYKSFFFFFNKGGEHSKFAFLVAPRTSSSSFPAKGLKGDPKNSCVRTIGLESHYMVLHQGLKDFFVKSEYA